MRLKIDPLGIAGIAEMLHQRAVLFLSLEVSEVERFLLNFFKILIRRFDDPCGDTDSDRIIGNIVGHHGARADHHVASYCLCDYISQLPNQFANAE